MVNRNAKRVNGVEKRTVSERRRVSTIERRTLSTGDVYDVQSPSAVAAGGCNANLTCGDPSRVRGPGRTRSRTPWKDSRMSVSSVGQIVSESPYRSTRRVEYAREA